MPLRLSIIPSLCHVRGIGQNYATFPPLSSVSSLSPLLHLFVFLLHFIFFPFFPFNIFLPFPFFISNQNPARGSGGALAAGSLAEPQPKVNFVNYKGKILHLSKEKMQNYVKIVM